MMTLTKERKLHLEILRVIALFFVIFNHTSGFWLFTTTTSRPTYFISIFMSHLCKIAVPLFFMISGALLLKKEESWKEVFQKRIVRCGGIILLFSFFQYLRQPYDGQGGLHYILYFFKTIYTDSIIKPYWFLYSYMAILIMLPLLRQFFKGGVKKEIFIYLAALQFIFIGILPVIGGATGGKYYCSLELPILSSNIFFFLMGYFFEYEIPDSYKKISRYAVMGIVISIILLILCCILQVRDYKLTGNYTQVYYDELIAIPTFTVFYWIKYICCHKNFSENLKKYIIFLGGNTFGIFLLEDWIREKTAFIYDHLYFRILELPAALVWILAVLIIGNIITYLLRKVPILGKWLS